MRSWAGVCWFGVAAWMGAAACHSSESPSAGGGEGSDIVPVQSCTDLANAVCSGLESCTPTLLKLSYGDTSTCSTRAKLGCNAIASAPGSSAYGDVASACANAIRAAGCDGLLGTLPECEPTPGADADGAPCGADAQCKSTYCKSSNSSGCGVCTERTAAGASCTDDANACALGTYCDKASKCSAHAQKGAACTDSTQCDLGLQCVKGVCDRGAALGAACNSTDTPCDSLSLLACNSKTSVCDQIALADTNQPCGAVDGGYAACSSGGACVAANDMAQSGTCKAPAADGAACQSDGQCLSPARCIGGACKVQDPATCK